MTSGLAKVALVAFTAAAAATATRGGGVDTVDVPAGSLAPEGGPSGVAPVTLARLVQRAGPTEQVAAKSAEPDGPEPIDSAVPEAARPWRDWSPPSPEYLARYPEFAAHLAAKAAALAPVRGWLAYGDADALADLHDGDAAEARARASDDLATWDLARRRLSRGLLLSDADDPEWRARLEARIAQANDRVLGASRALEGVTEAVLVRPGDTPARLVDRRPYGWVVLLRWNRRGNLDPRRLPAGATLLAPLEPLWVWIDRRRGVLHVMLGDVWVREMPILVSEDAREAPAADYFFGTNGGIERRGDADKSGAGPLSGAWMRGEAREYTEPPEGRSEGHLYLEGRDPWDRLAVEKPVGREVRWHDRLVLLRAADSIELLGWLSATQHAPERVIALR